MPKFAETRETEIKLAIRDTVVLDPLISTRRLQKVLQEKGYSTASGGPLDREYISKLIRKLGRENAEKVNRQEVAGRIAELKERYRLLYDRLIRIAFFDYSKPEPGVPMPKHKDQIAAINTIIKWDLAILQAEMDAGIFERKLGTLEVDKRSQPLNDEQKESILNALTRWGFIDGEAVEVQPINQNNPSHGNTTATIDQAAHQLGPGA